MAAMLHAPSGLTSLGATGLVAFSASETGTGQEAWITDGTETGTRRVADVRPGTDSSAPSDFALLGDPWFDEPTRLYFSADDGTHGRELWYVAVEVGPHMDRDGDGAPDVLGGFPYASLPVVPTTTDDLVIDRLDATIDFVDRDSSRLTVRGWWDPPGSVRFARGDVRVAAAGVVGDARPTVRRARHGGGRVRFRVVVKGSSVLALSAAGIDATTAGYGSEFTIPVAVRWSNHIATTARTVCVTLRGGRARVRLSR
jgi:ELWxxDGT repeat protein